MADERIESGAQIPISVSPRILSSQYRVSKSIVQETVRRKTRLDREQSIKKFSGTGKIYGRLTRQFQ